MTDQRTPRTAAPLHGEMGRIALNAIRWRSRDDNDETRVAKGDRRWLLRYIDEAEAAALDVERASGDAALREALRFIWIMAGGGQDEDHDQVAVLADIEEQAGAALAAASAPEPLDVERVALALLDSGLVARYNEYARQAHPNSMLLESDEAVARGWAPFVAAAYARLAAEEAADG